MKDDVTAPPVTVYITWCIVRAVGSHGNTENKKIRNIENGEKINGEKIVLVEL